MKYSKDVEWLAPYVQAAAHLVPLEKLKSVKGFKVHLGKFEATDGGIAASRNFKSYGITIRTHSHALQPLVAGAFKAVKHEPRNIENTLFSLAHELAHMKHWDHTPEHGALMARIYGCMAREAKKRGLKDLSRSFSG